MAALNQTFLKNTLRNFAKLKLKLGILSLQKMTHMSLSGTFVQFSDVIISLHLAVLEKLITPQRVTKLSK